MSSEVNVPATNEKPRFVQSVISHWYVKLPELSGSIESDADKSKVPETETSISSPIIANGIIFDNIA